MKETLSKKETPIIIGAGVIIGIIAVALVYFGNPANMGFCIACFLRDTSGALGFHSAAAVQYIRPEIVGLVLGSCILALATKEFKPRGGSAPVTRFVIGMFVMIGCLMFLGCPFRMGADFYRVVKMVEERLKANAVPIQLPIGKEDTFVGIIDLVEMKAEIYKDDLGKEYEMTDIPDDLMDLANEWREKLLESVE